MKTSRPVSTISYNTPDYLEMVLNRLVRAKKIVFWTFVGHVGEYLEDGTKEKDHMHVYIEPNTRIDTMELEELTIECIAGETKPRKCIWFQSSQWDDWYLYALHDDAYLRYKGEDRQYAYTNSDFRYSDEDEFLHRTRETLHRSKFVKARKINDMILHNSLSKLVYEGRISKEELGKYLTFATFYRQGYKEHQVVNADDPEALLGVSAEKENRVDGEKRRLAYLNDDTLYECELCGNHYPESEMSMFKLDTLMGICRNCSHSSPDLLSDN